MPRGQAIYIHLAVGRIRARFPGHEYGLRKRPGGRKGGDLLIDTGSGNFRAVDVTAERISIDTSSGHVNPWLPEDLSARLVIDTGSGSIDTDFPVAATRSRRGRLEGQIGDGRGSVVVDTGSGSVRLRVL